MLTKFPLAYFGHNVELLVLHSPEAQNKASCRLKPALGKTCVQKQIVERPTVPKNELSALHR